METGFYGIAIHNSELNEMLTEFYNLDRDAEDPILDSPSIYIHGSDEFGYKLKTCCYAPYGESIGYRTFATLEEAKIAICEEFEDCIRPEPEQEEEEEASPSLT